MRSQAASLIQHGSTTNTFDWLETWIRRVGVALGLVTIVVPILGYRRASARPRGRRTGKGTRFLGWPATMAAAALYLAGGKLLWRPLPLRRSALGRQLSLLFGSLCYFPGVVLYLWGYKTLGEQFSPSSSFGAQLYAGHRLVTRGPYALVRHPMYLGVMLAATGALLLYRTWAMLLYTLSAFVAVIRAKREEDLLAEEFGAEWAEYCSRVPRWILRLRNR